MKAPSGRGSLLRVEAGTAVARIGKLARAGRARSRAHRTPAHPGISVIAAHTVQLPFKPHRCKRARCTPNPGNDGPFRRRRPYPFSRVGDETGRFGRLSKGQARSSLAHAVDKPSAHHHRALLITSHLVCFRYPRFFSNFIPTCRQSSNERTASPSSCVAGFLACKCPPLAESPSKPVTRDSRLLRLRFQACVPPSTKCRAPERRQPQPILRQSNTVKIFFTQGRLCVRHPASDRLPNEPPALLRCSCHHPSIRFICNYLINSAASIRPSLPSHH